MDLPKVSVSLITYNQEKYIAECLESILKQKVNFSYEVVVSDDCSSDKTGLIIETYAAKYPQIIRYINRPANLGMVRNAVTTISECRGQYIALMEGDDFWMDENKLQMQADFLDNNADCVFCFTNQFEFYEHGNYTDKVYYNSQTRPPDKFDLDFFFQHNPVIPNNSKMFRKEVQPATFPDWFYTSFQWDWVLHILQGKTGKFAYLDYVTLAYRRHQKAAAMFADYTFLAFNGLKTLKYLNEYLDYKYDSFWRETYSFYYNRLAISYLGKRKIFRFLYYYIVYLFSIRSRRHVNLRNDVWRIKQIITGREWK